MLRLALEISSGEKRHVSLDLRLADGTGGVVAFGSLGTLNDAQKIALSPGANAFEIELPAAQFANGSYFLSLDLTEPFTEYFDRAENCLSVDFARASAEGGTRILAQSWGCGSVEIPLSLACAHAA